MSETKKFSSEGDSPKRKSSKRMLWFVAVVLAVAAVWGIRQYTSMTLRYQGDKAVWLKIPHSATVASVTDSLVATFGEEYGRTVAKLWKGNPEQSRGAYRVEPGEKAITLAHRLDTRSQTPIRLTFNNIRTFDQLDKRLTAKMDWEKGEFAAEFPKVAASLGVTDAVLLGRMLPDTYEVYWTTGPQNVIVEILNYYESFWTPERCQKAKSLGLTPDEVGVIASIAEEETAKADERGKVARLYINRLQKGMKLQADPTVKYAVGDFSIKRVGGKMLNIDSPYNTYRYFGLPPSPIRIPERRTLQAVLDAPRHNYLYMCAKSDFSGYHDFTSNYAEHQRNAAKFRRALDSRGIKL